QGYKLQSNSVEIYEGSGNTIHDNQSVGDRVFSELGSSAEKKATNNRYTRNLFSTSLANSRFITTRGAGDRQFGPVNATRLDRNTTYQTGQGSQGVVCSLGCGAGVLSMTGNIIWAEQKAVFADAPFPEAHDVFWSSTGAPNLDIRGFTLS